MFTPADRLKNIRKSATRMLYDSAPAGSINLGLGEPDFATPEFILSEATRVIEQEHNGYTPNAGILALRERIARYHSDQARAYTPASVCVTNGSEEALFATVMTIAGPGDEVLLPDPGYLAYPPIVEMASSTARYYSLPAARGFAFDRESFDRAVTEKTKLIILLSPSNPTGRVLSRGDLQFIAKRLSGSGVFVVSDEIYRDLYFVERPGSISEFYEKTIIISGLSKSMSMTGWRIGWAVGPEEIINHITVMHQYVSTCASAVTQKAAVVAFGEEASKATAGFRDELRERQRCMRRGIERELGLPFVEGEGAYYTMLDVSRFGPSMDTALRLLENRVITVPGSAFGPEGEGFLRLSFSVKPELIEEGICRIASGLEKA